MFKIVADPTFTHTVKIKVPIDGGFTEETCKATYRVLDPAVAESFDLGSRQGSTDFLRAAIVRLDDLCDAEKKPVEWSDAVFTQVLRLPYARVALARGYYNAVTEAVTGN